MNKLLSGILVLVLGFFCCSVTSFAENETLVIAVVQSTDAMNIPVEEAFFKAYPNASIEYHLYTENQLNTMLITNTSEFDLVILPYPNLLNMAKKGYLVPMEQILDLSGYPESLIDLSGILTLGSEVFALPVSIAQQFWIWDANIAEQIGISYPADAWTWADYIEIAKCFPKDINEDGRLESYLMYGSYLPTYPAFENVNLNMFIQYATQYSDFRAFSEQYLKMFHEIMISDALLNMNGDSTIDSTVLIREASAANPIDIIDGALVEQQASYCFLPPPLLDEKNVQYAGSLSACAMMRNARNKELAAGYIQAMISEDSLEYGTFGQSNQFIARETPAYMYFDMNGEYSPVFSNKNGQCVYTVCAGRSIPIFSFPYSDSAYTESQDFRAKLSVDTFLFGRDFYDSAWSYFQDWYTGKLSDKELVEAMTYMFGIAEGSR